MYKKQTALLTWLEAAEEHSRPGGNRLFSGRLFLDRSLHLWIEGTKLYLLPQGHILKRYPSPGPSPPSLDVSISFTDEDWAATTTSISTALPMSRRKFQDQEKETIIRKCGGSMGNKVSNIPHSNGFFLANPCNT